jgi:hypothetical protein
MLSAGLSLLTNHLSPLHFFRSNRARARARPRARLERVIRPLGAECSSARIKGRS